MQIKARQELPGLEVLNQPLFTDGSTPHFIFHWSQEELRVLAEQTRLKKSNKISTEEVKVVTPTDTADENDRNELTENTPEVRVKVSCPTLDLDFDESDFIRLIFNPLILLWSRFIKN